MTDRKISELTALTSVTDTDKFAIVDDSATETKHVVRDDIFGQGLSSSDSPTFVAGTFTGDLAVNTDTLFVDASADRVGINTSTPTTTLDVRATLAGIQIKSTTNQADLYFSCPNTTENRIFFGDTDDFDVGSIKYIHSTDTMAFTVDTATVLTIAPTVITSTLNVMMSNAQPTLQLVDTDGTNQYGQVLQAGANLTIRSRNDSANGGVVIAGFGGGVNTNFATWAAGGKFTMIYGVAMTGLPTSASGLSAGDIWNNSGVLNIV